MTNLMRDGGSPDANSTGASDRQVKKTMAQKITVDDFVFELESCKMTNGKVVCWLTINNDSPTDRGLKLQNEWASNKTRIFDEFGNEYLVESFRLGSEENKYGVENKLVSQVKTRAAVRFENVTVEATKITLSIAVYSRNSNKDFVVTMRDIQLQK
jgi:alpha-glucosidase (family GH31 glycosyl hydrolase)